MKRQREQLPRVITNVEQHTCRILLHAHYVTGGTKFVLGENFLTQIQSVIESEGHLLRDADATIDYLQIKIQPNNVVVKNGGCLLFSTETEGDTGAELLPFTGHFEGGTRWPNYITRSSFHKEVCVKRMYYDDKVIKLKMNFYDRIRIVSDSTKKPKIERGRMVGDSSYYYGEAPTHDILKLRIQNQTEKKLKDELEKWYLLGQLCQENLVEDLVKRVLNEYRDVDPIPSFDIKIKVTWSWRTKE